MRNGEMDDSNSILYIYLFCFLYYSSILLFHYNYDKPDQKTEMANISIIRCTPMTTRALLSLYTTPGTTTNTRIYYWYFEMAEQF